VAGCCEQGNEPFGCIKFLTLHDRLRYNYLLCKDYEFE
jgi:hypothetical protein